MDLAAEEHASAFGVLSRLTDVTWTSATEGPQEPYALLYELRGTESHLKCNLDLAIAAYEQVLIIDPSSIDTKLKLASVFLDLGERAKVGYMWCIVCMRCIGCIECMRCIGYIEVGWAVFTLYASILFICVLYCTPYIPYILYPLYPLLHPYYPQPGRENLHGAIAIPRLGRYRWKYYPLVGLRPFIQVRILYRV
jgi:hypothetical protein